MRFEKFSFGSIRIDGTTYQYDVVIDRGQIRKRKKKPSKPFRDAFGHTPLSIEEEIPWKCSRLLLIRLFQQTTSGSMNITRASRVLCSHLKGLELLASDFLSAGD